MAADYVELHARSFYAFGEGASHPHELLAQAQAHGSPALALTDSNLCGALEFARLANHGGIQPITGGELTQTDGSRLILLAKTREGYANLSRLFTLANAADRRALRLDPACLPDHAAGLILLTGGRDGPLARLAEMGRYQEAQELLGCYRGWFGPETVYVELQRTFRQGDGTRNRVLTDLARAAEIPLVATNDVRYHVPARAQLQQALAAARRFGVPFRNPCVNRSQARAIPDDGVRLRLQGVKDVGRKAARSLVEAGAFDVITPNRRRALREAESAIPLGRNGQRALAVETAVPALADWTDAEKMRGGTGRWRSTRAVT